MKMRKILFLLAVVALCTVTQRVMAQSKVEIEKAPSGSEKAVVAPVDRSGGNIVVTPGRDTPGGTGPGVQQKHVFPNPPPIEGFSGGNKRGGTVSDKDITVIRPK
jgi:hypothetical protein